EAENEGSGAQTVRGHGSRRDHGHTGQAHDRLSGARIQQMVAGAISGSSLVGTRCAHGAVGDVEGGGECVWIAWVLYANQPGPPFGIVAGSEQVTASFDTEVVERQKLA